MNYLTVQDMLWLHFQITKESCAYNYASLEAATYTQYGYGVSTDLFQQASQFYHQILLKIPFTQNNSPLALVAVQCFLNINGYFCDNKEILKKYLELKDPVQLKSVCYQGKLQPLQECIKNY